MDLLIELGEFEAAGTDRLFPEADGLDDLARCLRGASLSAAYAVLGARQDMADPTYARSVLRQLTTISAGSLPHAVCLGIRSIGTSLSAVVAAALESRGVGIDLYSVRPHGHPFHRTLSLRADLAAAAGLSGSSFASVAEALAALGVPAAQVVLFASWDCDGSTLKSKDARSVWQRHRRYAPARQTIGKGIDWSAGAWRGHVLGNEESARPAVQPQHEVEKAYLPDDDRIVRSVRCRTDFRTGAFRSVSCPARHAGTHRSNCATPSPRTQPS